MPNIKSEVRRAISLLKKSSTLTADDLSEQARHNASMESAYNGNHGATDDAIHALRQHMVDDALRILRVVYAAVPDGLEIDPPVPQTFANQWAAYIKSQKKPFTDFVQTGFDKFRLVFLTPTDYDNFMVDHKIRGRVTSAPIMTQAKGFMGIYVGADREETEIYVDVDTPATLTNSIGILKDKD